MVELEKKNERAENCYLLTDPRVNKKIWDAINQKARSDDINLQVFKNLWQPI